MSAEARRHTEIERKYDVDSDAALPSLRRVSGVADVSESVWFELDAVYFDTAALDLLEHRIALRHRSGGHDAGWHLKQPAEEGRAERHWEATPEVPDEVPAEIATAVEQWTGGAALTPLVRLRTRRGAVMLLDEDGELVAEIADDSVHSTALRTGVTRRWREWEAELGAAAPGDAAGRAALLDEIEERLISAGARPSVSVAKLARALGLEHRGPADAPLTRKSPVGEALLTALAALVEQLADLEQRAVRDEEDAVHQARVRVRRLRSLLAAYRPLLDRGTADRLRGQLAELGDVLGIARDIEVRARRAEEQHEDAAGEAADAVREQLAERAWVEYAFAHAALVVTLEEPRFRQLRDDLHALLVAPPLSPRATEPVKKAVPAALTKAAKRVRREAKRAGKRQQDEAALHEVRKAARRLRYAAEAMTEAPVELMGGPGERIAEAAERVHKLLGDHRDEQLFAEHVRGEAEAARERGEEVEGYQPIIDDALGRARRLLDDLDDALHELRVAVKAL